MHFGGEVENYSRYYVGVSFSSKSPFKHSPRNTNTNEWMGLHPEGWATWSISWHRFTKASRCLGKGSDKLEERFFSEDLLQNKYYRCSISIYYWHLPRSSIYFLPIKCRLVITRDPVLCISTGMSLCMHLLIKLLLSWFPEWGQSFVRSDQEYSFPIGLTSKVSFAAWCDVSIAA